MPDTLAEDAPRRGLVVKRRFAPKDIDPLVAVGLVERDSVISNPDGSVVFEMNGVTVPPAWSQLATDIVVSKYFRKAGVPETGHEVSAVQPVRRIAKAIRAAGERFGGYFASEEYADNFEAELSHMLIHQIGAFNSPVWFNVGLFEAYGIRGNPSGCWTVDEKEEAVKHAQDAYSSPPVSACFIQSINDDLMDIAEGVKREIRLFKFGAGTGSNFSAIRAKGELLSGGGTSSGLMSFLEIFDRAAGAIKSGGTCLAPDQRVFTNRGPLPVKHLAESGKDFVALSYDPPARRYKAKTARAWLAGEKKVVEITTDKGKFRLTSDHPVKLSSGDYCLAGSLRSGMSIFSCSADTNTNGYVRVGLRDGKGGRALFHRLVAQDVMGLEVRGLSVHHKDGNKHNNSPQNLETLKQSAHARAHSQELVARGEHVFQNRKFPKKGQQNGMHRNSAFWQDAEKVSSYKAKQSVLLGSERASAQQDAAARQKACNSAYKIINAGHSIETFEDYIRARKKVIGRIGSITRLRQQIDQRFGSYADFLTAVSAGNHRVKSVVPVGVMPVYDVEVDCPTVDDKTPESGHNFVIWSSDTYAGHGVVVANTRRAAKMVCLDLDHPDIEKFINWKVLEEDKVRALIKSGYSADFNGEAYRTVSGQNSNNSVRAPDAFMKAVESDGEWSTTWRTTGEVARTYKARDLMRQISEAAWSCADPGMQFHDTINGWHTCPASGEIRASNPCCFPGETLIDTSAGLISIEELAEMDARNEPLPYAYSFDRGERLPVLRRIKRAWKAGDVNELVEVRTQRGIILRCTPEHRFLTHAGDYVAAKDLCPGTRLRKISRKANNHRSGRRYLMHRVTDSHSNGCVWQNRFVWEQVHGDIPDGLEVHHVNEDPTDDRLENLELRESAKHRSEHSTGECNPRFINANDALLLGVWEAVAALPRKTHLNGPPVTVARWNAYIRTNGLVGKVPLASLRGVQGMSWEAFSEKMGAASVASNDVVTDVNYVSCETTTAVYDIEVSDVNNFGVTMPGAESLHTIVVHNSEYLFLDDTACNLASINLVKFLDGKTFDVDGFTHACEIFTLAQEILVDYASYPSKDIAQRSHDFRTLGLGYANLGALLMRLGLPYDSGEGRRVCSTLTSVLTGTAYLTSARIARQKAPFAGFSVNREAMLAVIEKHLFWTRRLSGKESLVSADVAVALWEQVYSLGSETGFRNAQISVLAPTGTIGLLMDCDTTGVEPDFALVKHKKLAGGGSFKIVNQSVGPALTNLGYSQNEISAIKDFVEAHETVEGAPFLKAEHLPIFDCANRCGKTGKRFIAPMGHIRMMAAAQPFLSGAISKTINIPEETTVEEIQELYVASWRQGLKAVALYRNNCKASQVLHASSETEEPASPVTEGLPQLARKRLPKHRMGFTQEATVGGQKIYLRTGDYADGQLGEIFLDIAKEGADLRSWANAFAISISLGLQHGVPLKEFVDAFIFTRFNPCGQVKDHANIKMAMSPIDYVFRALAFSYLQREDLVHVKTKTAPPVVDGGEPQGDSGEADAPFCPECGHTTKRNGTCYRCHNCGLSLGCS